MEIERPDPCNELANEIAAKAQETIHSLFDWEDAFFRFDEGATLDPDQIEVNLSVDEMIVEGKKRAGELREIRKVFESSGVVLKRTDVEAPGGLIERPSTRRIFEAIDGRRSIAEILLFARVSGIPRPAAAAPSLRPRPGAGLGGQTGFGGAQHAARR